METDQAQKLDNSCTTQFDLDAKNLFFHTVVDSQECEIQINFKFYKLTEPQSQPK